MEDFEVVIHIPGIKEIQKNVIEYNRALEDLAASLQNEYGTTNMATAMSIAAASSFFEIGLNVASFGFGFAGLFGGSAGYSDYNSPGLGGWKDDYSKLPNIGDLGPFSTEHYRIYGEWNGITPEYEIGVIDEQKALADAFRKTLRGRASSAEKWYKDLGGN